MTRIRRALSTLLTLGTLAAIGAADAAQAAEAGEMVMVDRSQAAPRVVEVVAGGRVTFHFPENESLVDDMLPVTIVFDDGFARSPALEPGESWTLQFPAPGVYRYRLQEHEGIEGTVVVK